MAYPTSAQLNWKAIDAAMGSQPLMDISTTQKHDLGTRVRGRDAGTLGYGIGEFIYLKGVASTAAGDVVIFDTKAATTTRAVAASRGPVAVAVSANVANSYGWYQIYGNAAVSSTGAVIAGSQLMVTATDGRVTLYATATQKIDGMIARAAQDTPTTAFVQAQLSYPVAANNGA